MQIKTTMTYPVSHLSEWLKSTTQETTGAGENVEKKEPWCTVGGNANWCNHLEDSMEVPQKVKNRNALQSSNHTTGYIPKEYKNTNLKRHMTPLLLQHYLQQPKHPSIDQW